MGKTPFKTIILTALALAGRHLDLDEAGFSEETLAQVRRDGKYLEQGSDLEILQMQMGAIEELRAAWKDSKKLRREIAELQKQNSLGQAVTRDSMSSANEAIVIAKFMEERLREACEEIKGLGGEVDLQVLKSVEEMSVGNWDVTHELFADMEDFFRKKFQIEAPDPSLTPIKLKEDLQIVMIQGESCCRRVFYNSGGVRIEEGTLSILSGEDGSVAEALPFPSKGYGERVFKAPLNGSILGRGSEEVIGLVNSETGEVRGIKLIDGKRLGVREILAHAAISA